jgi:hypothetical protein
MEVFWGLLGVVIGSAVTIVLQVLNLKHQERARKYEASLVDARRNEDAEREASQRVEEQVREAACRLIEAFNAEEIRRMNAFADRQFKGESAEVMRRVVKVYAPLRLELMKARLEPFSDEVVAALVSFDRSLDDVLGGPDAAVGMPRAWAGSV